MFLLESRAGLLLIEEVLLQEAVAAVPPPMQGEADTERAEGQGGPHRKRGMGSEAGGGAAGPRGAGRGFHSSRNR